MKYNFMAVLATLLLVNVSCKKNSEGTNNDVTKVTSETKMTDQNGKIDSTASSSVEKTVDGNKMGSNSYTYKGTDGSRARVIFSNSERDHTITIEANNNKFQLDRKEMNASGAKYERNGVSAQSQGDRVTITQGNNVIELVRDK